MAAAKNRRKAHPAGSVMGSRLSLEQQAQAVAMSCYDTDENITKRFGISARTLFRYRERVAEDEEFAALVESKKTVLAAEWVDVAIDFLRSSVAHLKGLVMQAGPEQLHQAAGAIKIIGELLNNHRSVAVSEKAISAGFAPDDTPTSHGHAQAGRGREEATGAGNDAGPRLRPVPAVGGAGSGPQQSS